VDRVRVCPLSEINFLSVVPSFTHTHTHARVHIYINIYIRFFLTYIHVFNTAINDL
jgi:hypothetical protein